MPEDNGNGKLEEKKEEVKTPEQLTQERLERYQKNPETFIELSDIITCCIRNPKSQLGISIFTGNAKRSELDIGQVELNHRIDLTRRQMDIEAERVHAAQKNLITPKHGMIDGARKLFGRK